MGEEGSGEYGGDADLADNPTAAEHRRCRELVECIGVYAEAPEGSNEARRTRSAGAVLDLERDG